MGKFIGDGSREIKAGCNQLSIIPDPTTPYRPQSNSITERGVGLVTDAAKTILVQSGLPHTFWPFAVKYVCFARNNQPCAKLNSVTPWFA